MRLGRTNLIVLALASGMTAATGVAAEGRPVWINRSLGPSLRWGNALAYDSDRGVTVLFGGTEASAYPMGDTWEWDGSTWTLRATTGPRARAGHAMAYDSARGVTVLFGGSDGSTDLSDTWEWDGTTWELVSSSGPGSGPGPFPRHGDSMMAYDSVRSVVVLFGRYTNLLEDYDETWEWDGNTWALRATTGPQGFGHTMAYDRARAVTVLHRGVGETWEWDGNTWVLRAARGPGPGAGAAQAYDSARGVTILLAPRETWEWNGELWTLRNTIGPMPESAVQMAMVYDEARGVAVLFAGDEMWEWDGNTWAFRWATTFNLGPRFDHAMAFDSAKDVIVLFGGVGQGSLNDDTYLWYGHGWTPLLAATGPGPRKNASMAYDSARRVTVLFGGSVFYDHEPSETWEWDGSAWTLRGTTGPATAQCGDCGGAMAYNSDRDVTVFFDANGETWEWDGNAWTRRTTNGPTPRVGSVLVYDSDRRVIVLFGGYYWDRTTRDLYRDTWEWDSHNWTLRASISPTPRFEHAMVYDRARRVTVLFGGCSEAACPDGETWEWDGSSWTQRVGTGPDPQPTPRRGHAMVYNELRGVTVLYGGRDNYGYGDLGDMWEFGMDCNSNGKVDIDDIASGVSFDCQTNGIPDECDIAGGTSEDCQPNGTPDECDGGCEPPGTRTIEGGGTICGILDCMGLFLLPLSLFLWGGLRSHAYRRGSRHECVVSMARAVTTRAIKTVKLFVALSFATVLSGPSCSNIPLFYSCEEPQPRGVVLPSGNTAYFDTGGEDPECFQFDFEPVEVLTNFIMIRSGFLQ